MPSSPLASIAAWMVAILLVLALLGTLRIGYRAYRGVAEDFERPAPSELLRHGELLGIAGLRDQRYASRDGTAIAAWYVPSRNGAAIVLTSGTSADRSTTQAELQVLAGAGFGVLAFDWPGSGESGGSIRWNEPERAALRGAIDWLSLQPGIDPARLGAFGFSYGGYITAVVAAEDPRLRAVVLAGSPTDVEALVRWQNRKWGPLGQWPATLALHRYGLPGKAPQPRDVIAAIAPRPLLLIGGSADDGVPPEMAQELYARAGEPKSLWIVPGAGHGQYATVAAQEYPRRLIGFFEDGLLR